MYEDYVRRCMKTETIRHDKTHLEFEGQRMHPESPSLNKVGKIQDFDESFYRTDVEMDF